MFKLMITVQIATGAIALQSPPIPSLNECLNSVEDVLVQTRDDISDLYQVVDITGECIEIPQSDSAASTIASSSL